MVIFFRTRASLPSWTEFATIVTTCTENHNSTRYAGWSIYTYRIFKYFLPKIEFTTVILYLHSSICNDIIIFLIIKNTRNV